MKNVGLKNRFAPTTRLVWLYWHACLVCGRNGIEDLHHIMSPSSRHFRDGEHNTSVLNSCPIHNRVCHIGNDSFLHSDEQTKKLLNAVVEALDFLDYKPNENDRKFYEVYKHLYSESSKQLLKSKFNWE